MIDELQVTRVVHATPQQCHDLVADVENYPRWASGITDVNVLARDDHGRPTEVKFSAAAFGRSATYTLAYDHSDAPARIGWQLISGDILRQLDGHYRFETVETDEGSTAVSYRLAIELAVALPGFIKRRAEARIAHTAIDDLQKMLEVAPVA